MSPLNSLRGAQYEPSEALLIIILLYYCTHSRNGGRVNLFAHKGTAIVKLYHYS